MNDICFYLTHCPMDKGYKFQFLADQLKQMGFSVETVLCCTEQTGVRPGDFSKDEIKSMDRCGTYIKTKREMQKYVTRHRFRYFVVGTYSGDLSKILSIARSKGSKIIEVSTLGFNDPVEHNADINLMISKLAYQAAVNKRPKRAKKAKNKHYVGALLADDIPNTYTSSLRSTNDFREKYNVKGRLFVWMPGREDLLNTKFQRRLTKYVGKNDTLLIKPHPWSYKLHQGAIKKVSRIMPVVSDRDAYWAIKSMDAAVSVNSTVGIELAAMRKPIIYLEHISRRPYINKKVGCVGFVARDERDMSRILREHNFVADKKYESHLNKVYPSPYKPAHDRICEFFKGVL